MKVCIPTNVWRLNRLVMITFCNLIFQPQHDVVRGHFDVFGPIKVVGDDMLGGRNIEHLKISHRQSIQRPKISRLLTFMFQIL